MNTILKTLVNTLEKILTSDHVQAKKARSMLLIHLVLQGLLFATVLLQMRPLFYVTFILYLFITVQIIVHGIKLNQKN